MVKSPKKVNKKRPKHQSTVKKASSRTSADASPTTVKGTKKRPLSTKSAVKTKTLLKDNSMCSEDLPKFYTKPTRKKQKLTETFKKYGVIVPSLEEIIVEQEQIREYKEQVQRAMQLKKPNFTTLTTPTSVRRSDRIRLQASDAKGIDCKHLTLEEITWYFKNYVSMLRKIIRRKKPSDGHKQYHLKKDTISQNKSYFDMKFSANSMVFTFDQVDYMATLMNDHFESEDISTAYLFQVLIPELCLKIFMDVHNMDKQQAKSFFEKCSVE